MILADIDNKEQFDLGVMMIREGARKVMHDIDVSDMFCDVVCQIGPDTDHKIEHAVLVAFDTKKVDTDWFAKQILIALLLHARTFLPDKTVTEVILRWAKDTKEWARDNETRSFSTGVWFNVTMTIKGEVVKLEEHDWHAGGAISADKDKTLEQTFIDHAKDRILPSETTEVEVAAFLKKFKEDMVAKANKEITDG